MSTYENSLKATVILRNRQKILSVIAPYLTKSGRPVSRMNGSAVALFPYVRGRTLYDAPLSRGDVAKAAKMLARIHDLDPAYFPTAGKERFNNPFKRNILRLLRNSQESDARRRTDGYRRKTLRLLKLNRAGILDAQTTMADLKVRIQRLRPTFVFTHGDSNLANFIKDDRGRLFLTDWGDAGIGPAERDLFHFSGDSLDPFLTHYIKARKGVKLSAEIFAFYYYRWALQEISDCSTRILYLNSSKAEKRHAWSGLKPYIPVPQESISRNTARIKNVLRGRGLTS